ncbi:CEF3, partial [Symbiodinium microadriaticum]
KSTLLNVLCGELLPVPGPDGQSPGEVYKHRNLRLAYIAQQHMFHLAEFMNSTPYVYIQKRYQNGYDEALQRRLMEPANEEEAKRINDLARKYGKYGFEVGSIQSRVVRGNEVLYEVQWKGCDDPKQNTFENLSKLKKLGVVGLAKAYDERLAAQTAGIDQRPLTQKEIVKHLEQFGLDEDMILHRQIGSFSAGQKSKLTLGAAFWTKPHLIALDEPTNYIDMETLDALVQGLARYKGGIIVISHASEFVNQVCTEIWK